MTGSKALDVAIGLSFAYLLLSLLCSALNEILAGLIGLRQKTLVRGIRQLLTSEQIQKEVYAHPLIRSISHGRFAHTSSPSYISREVFAAALHDVLTDAGTLKKELAPAAAQVEEVKKALSALLKGTRVGERMDQQWSSFGTWAEKEREAIGRWFDDAMDRVTGRYKRLSQLIVVGIAVVVAGSMNADSFGFARALWTDSDLRAAVSENAKAFVASQGRPAESRPSPEVAADHLRESTEAYAATLAKLESLSLPMGWSEAKWARLKSEKGWGSKILGLLFTVVAISLGAPFWFDALSRLANLRSSGARPATGKPEGADSGGT